MKPKAYPLHLKTIHTKNAKKVKKNRVSKVKSCWPEKMDISDTSRLSNSCSSNATTMGLNPFWNSFHNFKQLGATGKMFYHTRPLNKIYKCFLGLQFLPINKRKQIDLRYRSPNISTTAITAMGLPAFFQCPAQRQHCWKPHCQNGL